MDIATTLCRFARVGRWVIHVNDVNKSRLANDAMMQLKIVVKSRVVNG